MATKQIAWTTGSGYITLTYTGQGDGTILVSSDDNTGAARSQTITIQTTAGTPVVTRTVTIYQDAGVVSEPLTFTFHTGQSVTITWKASNASVAKTIEYRINDGEWTSITSTTSGATITISGFQTNKKIQFRGDNTAYATSSYYNYFTVNANFEVSGNIMSLFSSTDFASLTTIPGNYALKELFHECTTLTNASALLLPATTLSDYCYYNMFYGCTNMDATPSLPATTLTQYCYYQMFYNCSSITDAPTLPATTLAASCYRGMFNGCSSLKTTQEVLPATTLTEACYRYMYYGCTSLLAAPELPAETLASQSYFYMFYNCSNLSYIKCLARDTSSSNCTYYWVSGVASTGVFVKNISKTNWSTGVYGIPTGWAVYDAGISLSTNSISADDDGETIQIVVESISSWTATTENDWITISPSSSNTTSTTVTITIAANSSEARSGNIVFSDGTSTAILSVSQEAASQYQPLTFDILGISGTIGWKASNSSLTKTIQYKKNDGEWTSITSTTSGVTISVASGDVVQFRGSNTAYGNSSHYNSFTSDCLFNVRGNIMSMFSNSGFESATTIPASYALKGLFYGTSYLKDASNLLMPATTLTTYCYQNMFYGCTNLTGVPSLPATTTQGRCYYRMFYNCSNITTAPVLNAATVATYGYYQMFYGCSKLNYIKCLATSISASNAVNGWVTNVAASGTFVKKSTMTGWPAGTSGIPSGWTVQNAS